MNSELTLRSPSSNTFSTIFCSISCISPLLALSLSIDLISSSETILSLVFFIPSIFKFKSLVVVRIQTKGAEIF